MTVAIITVAFSLENTKISSWKLHLDLDNLIIQQFDNERQRRDDVAKHQLHHQMLDVNNLFAQDLVFIGHDVYVFAHRNVVVESRQEARVSQPPQYFIEAAEKGRAPLEENALVGGPEVGLHQLHLWLFPVVQVPLN